MTTINYSALRKKAQEEGSGSSSENLPVGEAYLGEIVKTGAKAKSPGYSLWFLVKVLVGPEAGKTTFLNQRLDPENGKQLDIFFRVLGDLGIDFDQIPDGTPPESIAKLAFGRKIQFDIVHNPGQGDKVFANFKNITLVDGPVDVPAPPVVTPAAEPVASAPSVEELQAQIAALQSNTAPQKPDELPF